MREVRDEPLRRLMARRAPVLVVAPGAETTWSTGDDLTTQAAVVAVDASGAPQAYGSEAALSVARRHAALRLQQPFSSTEIFHPELARAYLRWLMARTGCRGRHAVMAVLVPSYPAGAADVWRQICEPLEVGSVMVTRPLAAASGLGIEVDSGYASLIVDVTADTVEVAVVADGRVLVSRRSSHRDPHDLAPVIRSTLVQVDPDLEWDVLSGGINVVGRAPEADWAKELSAVTGLPVKVTAEPERALIDGALVSLEALRPYISTVMPRASRLLREVLAGFGH